MGEFAQKYSECLGNILKECMQSKDVDKYFCNHYRKSKFEKIGLYMRNNTRIKKITFVLILLLTGIAYYFLLGKPGYLLQKDSLAFIEGDPFITKNYSIYVYFLRMCRAIFGQKRYLYFVFIIQGTIAMGVSGVVTEYFRRYFSLKYMEAFLVYICTLLPYGYSLPEEVATHHILTEGLSFSFFHLFMLVVIISFLEKKVYMMIPAGIMALVLTLTRSQLALVVLIYIGLWVVIGLQAIYRKINNRYHKIYWTILVSVFIIACMMIPSVMIGIIKSGKLPQFTDAISGKVLCAIEETDKEYLDEEYQGVFNFLYEQVDEKKQRKVYFREGLYSWEDIVINTNENTKMYESVISEYCKKENMEYGRYIGIYLTSTLFKHHLWDYFKMTFIVCAQSLVVSIFIQPTKIYMLCWCIAFGIYMSTIFLLIYSKKICCSAQCRIPMLITGTVLLGNVVITNIMFYGQQRYVVYTFGFFYISLFILGKEVLGKSIKKQQY